METNDSCKPVKHNTKALIGTIIAGAGVALLLFNLDIVDNMYRPLVFSWQTLLIVAGLLNLFSRNNWPTGLILLTIGSLFMVHKVMGYEVDIFRVLLPIALIIIGVIIVFKKARPFKPRMKFEAEMENCFHRSESKSSGGALDEVNIFSGSKRIYTDTPFEGGSLINIFGGSELDLRQTDLKDGTTILETVNIFGGMVLIVPEHWEIKSETVAILGGFSDKRKSLSFASGNKRLLIKGVNIFGGTEVKNDEWVK